MVFMSGFLGHGPVLLRLRDLSLRRLGRALALRRSISGGLPDGRSFLTDLPMMVLAGTLRSLFRPRSPPWRLMRVGLCLASFRRPLADVVSRGAQRPKLPFPWTSAFLILEHLVPRPLLRAPRITRASRHLWCSLCRMTLKALRSLVSSWIVVPERCLHRLFFILQRPGCSPAFPGRLWVCSPMPSCVLSTALLTGIALHGRLLSWVCSATAGAGLVIVVEPSRLPWRRTLCFRPRFSLSLWHWGLLLPAGSREPPDRSFGCKFTLSDNLHAKWGINCLYSKIGV